MTDDTPTADEIDVDISPDDGRTPAERTEAERQEREKQRAIAAQESMEQGMREAGIDPATGQPVDAPPADRPPADRDPAPEGERAQETREAPQNDVGGEAGQTPSPQTEAWQIFQQVEGDTDAERAETAARKVSESLEQLATQYQQTDRQLAQLHERREQLDDTITRLDAYKAAYVDGGETATETTLDGEEIEVANPNPPARIMQTMAGGVTFIVPPESEADGVDDWGDLRSQLADQRDDHDTQIAKFEDRADKLKRGFERTQSVAQHLQEMAKTTVPAADESLSSASSR